jgi:NAD(P)-dependent dehydrogenase (short-subunit alcohol dehydrogenase family)
VTRTALVTGSSRGIGRAIALRLAADHDGIVVHYRRNQSAAEEVAGQLRAAGVDVLVVRAELESEAELVDMVDAVKARWGQLDTLVANAAAGAFLPVLAQRTDQVQRTLDTIVKSFVILTGRAVPLMPAGGRVVAISGLDARAAVPVHGVIGAAKAALEALVRHLAVELGPATITVNAVVPGAVATDSSTLHLSQMPALRQALIEATPAGRFAEPDDVAAVVAFLCSPAAGFVSGTSVVVDGGLSAGGGPWASAALRGPQ